MECARCKPRARARSLAARARVRSSRCSARSTIVGRRRLGAAPAVPDHAAAPARPGLLVALRRAAAARRRRRAALRARRRAGPARRPRGGRGRPDAAALPRSSTGCSPPGFLLLGAAACSPRRSSARRSGGAGAGAPTSGRRSLLLMGVLMWPVMVFFTNSTIHMLAHGSWAQAMMLAGAAELGLARGKLHEPVRGACASRSRSSSRGRRCSSTSRTRGSSRARRSCTTCSAGRCSALPCSRSGASCGRARSRANSGFALIFARDRGRALLRPRRRADLRPPRHRSPGSRTDETRAPPRRAASRSRRPPSAFAHATLQAVDAEVRAARSRRRRAEVAAPLRPGREGAAERDPGLRRRAAALVSLSARGGGPATTVVARAADAAERRRTPCAGTRSRATATSSRASTRSASACRAPPPTEAFGAQGPTRTEHVVRWALLPLRSRCSSAGSASGCSCCAAPLPPRLEKRFYALERARRRRACSRSASSRSSSAPRTRSSSRSGALLYGDLSPIAGGTRFGHGVHRDDARVRARRRAALPRVADRTASRCSGPAFVLALGFASGLSLSGHSAADAGASKWSELADWVHLSAAMLWVGGLVALAAAVWPAAPELRRRRSSRFARLAPVLIALLLAAGIYLSVLRLPHVERPLDAGLRAGAAREARARRARARVGRVPPLPRRAAARARRVGRAGGAAAAEPARRERRRDGGAARGGGARRLEAAAAPDAAAGAGREVAPPVASGAMALWAISGGAGFLGLHLARRLVADGHEVRTLDLAPLDDAQLEGRVEELRGDVRERRRRAQARRGRRRARPRGRGAPDPGLARLDPLGERRRHRRHARRRARGGRPPRRLRLLDRGLRRARDAPDRRRRARSSASGTTASRRSRPSRSAATSACAGSTVVIVRPKTFIGPERLGVFEILFDWIREGRRIPILG